MRSVLAFCALAMALPPSLAAQDSTKAAPFVLAVGPSWNFYFTGVRLRAEYPLTQG